MNRFQLAALVGNTQQRKKALDNYYKNPNHCLFCNCMITVSETQKVSEVKIKKFCNKKCSTTYNNLKREKKQSVSNKKEKKIKNKKFDFILDLNKKDLYEKHGIYYKLRSVIRKHAHYVFNESKKEKKCVICGYSKFVEVCHIKSVSSFDNNTKIKEINSPENLIGLCPNHHKEFDNGLLDITAGGQVGSADVS